MYVVLKCRDYYAALDVFDYSSGDYRHLISSHFMWGRARSKTHGRIGLELGTGTHCNPYGAWYPAAQSLGDMKADKAA